MGVSLPLGYSPSNTPANCNLDAITAEIVALQGAASVVPGGGRTVTQLGTYLANNAVFNVKDFGAKGDGVTDDTAAILLAASKAMAVRGTILFPPGNYVQTADVAFTAPCHILLDGAQIVSTGGRLLGSSSNVTIDGRGTSSFTFTDAGADPLSDAIFFSGGAVETLAVTGTIAIGDMSFVATNAGDVVGLVAGAWVIVGERGGGDWQRQEWKQVLSVVGTTVNVTTPFRQNINTYTLTWWKATPVEDCAIVGLTVVTLGTVNDNVGVYAQLTRNFRMRDCRFNLAKGLAFAVTISDAPNVSGCTIDRQVGRSSACSAVIDGVFSDIRIGALGSQVTGGALTVETGTCFTTFDSLTVYGGGGGGQISVTWADSNRFVHCTVIGNGPAGFIAILVIGGDNNITEGNHLLNCFEGVRFAPDTGVSPTRTANGNSSIGDKVRNAGKGVNIGAGTNNSVFDLDVDASVATPIADAGTNTVYSYRDQNGVLHIFGQTVKLPGFSTQLAGAASAGLQLLLGDSSAVGAVGVIESDAGPFLAGNAAQPTKSTNLWHQSLSSVISTLLIMRLDSGNLELYEAAAGTADGNFATFWGTAKWTLNLNGGTQLMENGVKLLGARRTGWTAQTTTPARADMGATPSLATVYATLAAVIDDLTTHGLIGP